MDLRWEPHFLNAAPTIWYLLRGSDQLARVTRRACGDGWVSEVSRHRPEWKRRPAVVAPTERAARRWAEAYTRANLARILAELPRLHRTHCGTLSAAAPGP